MDGEKTRGADARKVRRLLKPARLDRRLSLTPPISVDSLSSADTHKAIGLNTHFFNNQSHQSQEWRTEHIETIAYAIQKITSYLIEIRRKDCPHQPNGVSGSGKAQS